MEILQLIERKQPQYVNRIKTVWEQATGTELRNKNITALNLVLFTEQLKTQVSDNSARTYLAYLKASINILRADGKIQQLPADWEKSARVKAEQVVMCHLTEDEVEKLVAYEPKNANERKVRAQFLVECYTGARSSDVVSLSADNIDQDGNIVYVSRKTKIRTIVPCKPLVRKILVAGDNIEGTKNALPLKTKNEIIRRMLRAAGVTENVKVYKGGTPLTGAKCDFCSTHTGRRTFCTNMYLRGVDLYSISKLAGHSSVTMTENYICCGLRNLPQEALNYFK